MRKSILFILIIGISSLFIVGCSDDSKDITNPITTPYDNTPVVVNALNAYTFTLNANDFSITRVDSLSFDADSLVVTLTLANHSTGDGDISIVAANSAIIFAEPLNENKVVIQTDIIGNIPEAVSIQLSDFTGSISFVLGKQE